MIEQFPTIDAFDNGCVELCEDTTEVCYKMEELGWIYRKPCINENSSESLKQKYSLAQSLLKEKFVVSLENT